MKHIVITGSTRGLGFELAKQFLANGCCVTLSGTSQQSLDEALHKGHFSEKTVLPVICNVRDAAQIEHLWHVSRQHWGKIDVWINNAGINQPEKNSWELTADQMRRVVETDLLGTMLGSQIAVREMLKQGFGAVYNMEGFGSDDSMMPGLNVYGTTKRAITYFTKALAKELKNSPVHVGRLSPGIMITDFITGKDASTPIRPQARKVFNILGDKPDAPARFLTERILQNTRNDVHFVWLTKAKAAWRFIKAPFSKRDLFE